VLNPSKDAATECQDYLTPQEVAERCGLSRRRVYDWLTWGWLRGQRRGFADQHFVSCNHWLVGKHGGKDLLWGN